MRTREKPIEAVLFDFAGTLFAPQAAAHQVALAAHTLGVMLARPDCERLAAQFLRAGMPGGPYPAEVPEQLAAVYARRDLSPDDHRAAYTALMSTVSAPDGLAALVYDGVRMTDGWVPYSDTYETVQALTDNDVRVGLVSNVGFDLRPILVAHGLDQLAAHATLSFEHGIAKPSHEIFELALASLGASAADTLMVGDHPVADGGATAIGIQTLILPMSQPGARHGLHRVLELALDAN